MTITKPTKWINGCSLRIVFSTRKLKKSMNQEIRKIYSKISEI